AEVQAVEKVGVDLGEPSGILLRLPLLALDGAPIVKAQLEVDLAERENSHTGSRQRLMDLRFHIERRHSGPKSGHGCRRDRVGLDGVTQWSAQTRPTCEVLRRAEELAV